MMAKFLQKFINNKCGNVAPIFAVAIIPIILSAGAAIDYSRMSSDMTRMQSAVDTALLAGGHDLLSSSNNQGRENARSMVRNYLEANLDSRLYSQIKNISISFGANGKTLTATVRASSPTTLLNIVGKEELNYRLVASTTAENGSIEVVLVLDNTGSMGSDNKLRDLKTASLSFVSDLLDLNKQRTIARIGIVPFSQYVNVGPRRRNANWVNFPNNNAKRNWDGCIGSRNAPYNLQAEAQGRPFPAVNNARCPRPITNLTSDKAKLNRKLSAMVATGATYIPGGLMWGLRVISSGAPFNQASSYGTAERENIKKVIVLMTDGENTVSPQIPASPYHNGRDLNAANNATTSACSNIKSNGISLYTVTFGSSITNDTKRLIESCASGSSQYFHAASGGNLSSAFSKISSDLKRLRLTQ